MELPTRETLLAEKAQLERRLTVITKQLRELEATKRAEAASRAAQIMLAHGLTLQDVRTSRHGMRLR